MTTVKQNRRIDHVNIYNDVYNNDWYNNNVENSETG